MTDQIVPDSETKSLMARLPGAVRDLASLARLDRPIGAWLLFWPGAWAIALSGTTPSRWDLLLWFALGAIAMRSAGCVWNDIIDRDLDRRVARTAARPVASGRISVRAALLWLATLCLVGLVVLLQLSPLARIVALASLAPVAAYPFMKRITWWPQAWLGLVFSWAVPVGWAETTGSLSLPGLLLWAGSVFWVIGYDTIYALQDIEDDALAGVKSSARALGRRARMGIASFYLLAVLFWGAAFWALRPQALALLALLPAAFHLAGQLVGLRLDDGAQALARFRANRRTGFLMFLGCMVVGLTL